MITINEVQLKRQIAEKLIEMSGIWAAENSCYGYRQNTIADIEGRRIFVAYSDNAQEFLKNAQTQGEQTENIVGYLEEQTENIVGYLFGIEQISDKESPTIARGSKVFEIEEIFVLPERRSQGIGRSLFCACRAALTDCDFITLSTATKDYERILSFYAKKLDMTFWSARFFQKLR